MIYGEESVDLEFSRGLWWSFTGPTPKGFCSRFRNLVVDEKGYAKPRGSFKTISGPTPVNAALRSFADGVGPTDVAANYFIWQQNPYFHSLSGEGEPRDLLLAGLYSASTTETIFASSRNGTSSVTNYNPGGFTNDPLAACLVRDRLYYQDGTTGIRRATGWNFVTSTAIATVLVAGSPIVTTPRALFYFKDRLFLIDKTRVYFTDAAAVGAYPETWNTSSNFFDLPSDTEAIITGYAILNDIIYFFTPRGTFALYVVGIPTNWQLRRLDYSIKVHTWNNVCTNKDIIYYTDRDSVYIYNGYNSQDIGAPVKEALQQRDVEGIGLFPFEDGIMLEVQHTTTQEILGVWYRIAYKVEHFYFNGRAWTEFTINDGSGNDVLWGINYSFASKKLAAVNEGYPCTIMSITIMVDGINPRVIPVSYVNDDYTQDQIISNATYNLNIIHELDVNTDFREHTYTRIKYGFIDLYSEGSTVSLTNYVDGSSTGTTQVLDPGTGVVDDNYFVKFACPQYLRRIRTKLKYTNTTAMGASTVTFAPFIWKKLHYILNSHRNVMDNVDG